MLKALAALLISSVALGFTVPELRGPVMDDAHILSPPVVGQLQSALQALYQRTGTQIQVFTISTLDDTPIETASIQIVDKWKLGRKGDDKGILLLIAAKERTMRIEVGRGLEGLVPDIYAKRIIADIITPYFKASRMDEGVVAGVMKIASLTNPDFNFDAFLSGAQQLETDSPWTSSAAAILYVMVLFALLTVARAGLWGAPMGRRRYNNWWIGGFGGGGSGGSGFGGFGGGGGWSGGGGGFNGGGASGNW